MAEQHGKTLVPQIRFAGFTDPWEQRKLGDILQERNVRTSDFESNPIFSLTIEDGITPKTDRYERTSLITKTEDLFKIVSPNEFVTNPMNLRFGAFGYNKNSLSVCVSGYYDVFSIDNDKCSGFWNSYFKTPVALKRFDDAATGSLIEKRRVKYSTLCQLIFLMPKGMGEKKQIGAFFDRLDSLITLHQRKYDKLCVLKKSMLDKMFPKGGSLYPEIRFAGFTDPWEQRKLGELFEESDERASDREILSVSVANGIYPASESDRETNPGASLANYKVVHSGDVVYNSMRMWQGAVDASRYDGIVSPAYVVAKPNSEVYARFFARLLRQPMLLKQYQQVSQGNSKDTQVLKFDDFASIEISMPASENEQRQIGAFFDRLDSLITLHQRKYDGCTLSPIFFRKVHTMQENITSESLFCDYYAQWVRTYKEGAIRDVTMGKYRLTQSWLSKLIPELRLADMDRTAYQQLINGYAQHHERQTTMDFHHQIKGAILDAVDEGLIPRDPTRKVIIKGKQPRIKKMKYLNQFELHAMLADLDLGDEASWDWLILLIAKTGLRFSEALGLTPDDFDFAHQTLSVSKTWDYKNGGGFVPTKNESSVRKVQLDWQLIMQLSGLLKNLPHDKPIFVHGKVYNSTANDVLARHCKNVDVPVISIHGLRHTHASLLLFAGVSIASVSRRLGHASMTTTQETYLHVIRELENKDVDIVMRALSTLI